MRLYDLSEQYNSLAEMLEEDTANDALKAMLDGLEDAFDSKVESIVKLMRSKAAECDAIDEEAQRLRTRASKLDREVEWLQTYVQNEMIATGKDKVKSNLFTITLRNNPPMVNVLNESEVPRYYITTKVVNSIDKRAILEYLKAGNNLPGVEMVQRKSLQIK